MTRGRHDAGQASVELALTLPLLVALGLLLVQVALVGRDAVLVQHAARVGARQAAVDARPASVARAVGEATPGLKLNRVSTETSHEGGSPGIVTVSVVYRSATDVPLVGSLFPDLVLRANAAMRDETGHAEWWKRRRASFEAGLAS